MESICSCSGSISSNGEEKEEGHTTPIDMKVLPPTAAEPIEKLHRKKILAMEELLQTERDYVHDLTHLVQVKYYRKMLLIILLIDHFSAFRFV